MCYNSYVSHHLLDAVEALAMKAEGLFKKNFILDRPLIWEGSEVGKVGQGALHVVFVPQQHAQSLRDRNKKQNAKSVAHNEAAPYYTQLTM